ncbi:MAG: periplasmic heavy metal sensor [Bryobacteraceae bacterium]|nr:periplasmic heavy metal sensor [Bryobacteraceae bacterium]
MLKTILATFALSGLLLAQGPGQGPRAGGQPPAPDALKTFLELTDAQVQQLVELRRSLPDTVKPFAEQIREKNQALREEMQKTNPDPAVVGKLMVEMKAIREQIHAEHAKLNDQAKALLTDAQKAKLAELEAAQKLAPAIRQAVGFGLIDGLTGAGRRGPGAGMMAPGGFGPGEGAGPMGPGMGFMGRRGARF